MNNHRLWDVALVVSGLWIVGTFAWLLFFDGDMPIALLVAAPFIVLARQSWKRAKALRTEFI